MIFPLFDRKLLNLLNSKWEANFDLIHKIINFKQFSDSYTFNKKNRAMETM